jgi:hypothetical protein
MIMQVPPAIVEKVGQGNTAELARLRGIQAALQHLEVSVDSIYIENNTSRKTTAKQTILVQVNVNGIPGVEVAREYHQGNLYYAVVRFDQSLAQALAVQKVNSDVDELNWLFNRPRTAGRKQGLTRVWAEIQRDIGVCKLLGAQGFNSPDRKIAEEFRGPRLIFVDDGVWSRSKDHSQRDLTNQICHLYSDTEGTRTILVQTKVQLSTQLRAHDAAHLVQLQISFNGKSHTLCEEIVTPRHLRPTPSQVLGAFGNQLEELISSL